MKNIYPNFYEVFPKPTDDGYVVLQCNQCQHNWMYSISELNEQTKCPYCGIEDTFDQFYYNASENTYNYFNMEALKNLLALINIDIDIYEQNKEDKRKKYQVRFLNIDNPNENEMSEYVKEAYLELQNRIKENTFKVDYKVFIEASDLVNEDEFIVYKTPCCSKEMKINSNDTDINHCIYCKTIYK